MNARRIGLLLLTWLMTAPCARAHETVLDARLHHYRVGNVREWSDFPTRSEAAGMALTFQSSANAGEWTLRWRQQDVKQTWKVLLNHKEIGRLLNDENDTIVYLPLPPGSVQAGENRLTITQNGKEPDDIRVGEIRLEDRPRQRVLNQAQVEVTVVEAVAKSKPVGVPCRLTITNAQGALMTVGAHSGKGLAVRPGVIYTANGKARFGLPPGEYTIQAGRGFEYNLATVRVSLKAGETSRQTLTLRREVPTEGWVSCDTHIHTLTYSGHGDCHIDERMVTLAGEGIELPIATEHNRAVAYESAAERADVRRYFTPVVGNEVTTAVGHFNIFPVLPNQPAPDFRGKDWKTIFGAIDKNNPRVVILNHPRDLHAGFRPFGPEHHLAATGTNLDGWVLQANAMEVLNSGAQQTEIMRLFEDWFGLLNAGHLLTPVGSSDSHDVSRFIVGQGRTYIRCKDEHPDRIDVDEAVRRFQQGQVMVSLGLLAEITVNERYGPGELVPGQDEVKVRVRVLGPGWTTADTVALYANGVKIRSVTIEHGEKAGVKWSGDWTLPRFAHDVHLVAIATGPEVRTLAWPIAKPYQPTSPEVHRRVLGASGAIWIDGDGDGKRTPARVTAQRLLQQAGGAWKKALPSLANHDEAIAGQMLDLLRGQGVPLRTAEIRKAARTAGPHVEQTLEHYLEAWRASELARQASR